MSKNMKTVLLIGATSGLGEQFARRFHALGKKVIITGRREERLASLKTELGLNVETYQWDISDFSTLSSRASQILTEQPDIDSVFLLAGTGYLLNFLDRSSKESEIIAECNINLTAQLLLSRLFMPHLASVAVKGQPATLLLTTAGLAFVPAGGLPVYSATKTAVHTLALALRQQIKRAEESIRNNLNIIEVVPPFVDTEFAAGFKNPALPPPMPVEEYIDDVMMALEQSDMDGKPAKEIATGSAKTHVDAWRASMGKYMQDIGIDC